MEYQEQFKFLNLQLIERKNSSELKEEDRKFIRINLLDKLNNPCSFLIFNKDLMTKVLSSNYAGLSDLTITFELVYNNNWSVRVVDIVG